MALSHELISQFAKVVNSDKKQSTETTIYGTVVDKNGHKPGDVDDNGNKIVIDENGGKYVKPDGSDQLIPITDTEEDPAKANTATNTDYGDRASVLIKNHTATVTGNISSPSASNKDIDSKIHEYDIVIAKQIQADKAYFEKVIADKASIGELEAAEAKITELEADKASVTDLDAANAEITNLKATKIDADVVEANYATIENLNTTNAKVGSLDVDIADINTLMFGSATGNVLQTTFANAVIALLGDAQIKSAMIESLNASKINAGSINTDIVKMESEDGTLIIEGNTIQVKDTSGIVRVQIGKDASDDYSINIWDVDGNLMFSEGGITDSAIKKAIIRNDMVSDDANIDAKKLDIDSLFTEMNDDGTPTLKSTKVYFDSQKQTLDVAFNEMNTTVTEQGEQISAQGTGLSVIQGQISSKVWQQDIDTAKDELNTKYSQLEQNVDGFKIVVQEVKSDIDTSYEAAKEAYDKAQNAQNTAENAQNRVDNLKIGGRNLLRCTENLPVTYDLETGLSTFGASIKPATVTGSIISISDVSPIEHDIKVTLLSEPNWVNRFDIVGVTGSSVDPNYVDNTINVNSGDAVNLGKLTDICTGVKGGDTIKMSFESDDLNSVLSLALLTSNNSYTSLCSVYSLSGSMAFGEEPYVICTLPEDISNIYVQHYSGWKPTLSDIFIGLAETVYEDLSTVTVSRYGKNLIPYPYSESSKTQNGVTYTDNGDGSILISGSATGYTDFFINTIVLNKNTQYCYSGFADSKNIVAQVILKDVNQNTITTISANPLYQSQKVIVFNTDIYPTAVTATLLIKRNDNATVSGVIKPQLEVGLTATEYEPYKKMQTVKANADGTVEGLTSLSPNMTLTSNSDAVTIECTYNQYIGDYVFEETKEGLKYTVPANGKGGISIPLTVDGIIQNGETITLSFDYRGTLSDMGSGYLLQRTSPNVSFKLEWTPAESETEWQHYSYTFSSNTANDRVCYALLLFYLGAGSCSGEWIEIKKGSLKLEKGEKATDWSPAPEEMASSDDLKSTADNINRTITEHVATLTTNADSIVASVSSLQKTTSESINNINTSINELRNEVKLKVTDESVDIAIQKAMNDGTKKVDTGTGIKFDIDGMKVDKIDNEGNSVGETNTRITENGMKVNSNITGKPVLEANKDGVVAANLHAKDYLIVGKQGGRSRFEDYVNNRTACFWIGE